MTRIGILTISDRSHRGQRDDRSGPAIRDLLVGRMSDISVEVEAIVPDELAVIRDTLLEWADILALDLVLTTGGTGFAPRDVTPEATRAVLDREAPGLGEAMRAASLHVTPHAMLSRAVAGVRKSTLIVNLPGSPRAVKENLEVLMPALPHALALLRGETPDG
ncbi:MAG TPA: molybdopterin adenylyltransferase [Anaerolineae bacterium]|nr:molybdopterin adenylyltransferase [Anaerolineae bacterium]